MSIRREDARIFQHGQHSVIPVLLRESVLDSVTFRAATKHFDDQLEAVDLWLNAFIKQHKEFTAQFCRLEEQALGLYNRSPPTFIESGIVDADYTVTAMSRSSDANKAYWTSIFANARSVEQTITEPLLRLQHHEMKEIRHLRNDFYKQQKLYDETLRYYYQQPKSKEASSLREDAFQLYEKRKGYIKSSFDYTIKLSTFRAALDAALISAFARSFQGTSNHTSALATDFASRPSISRIMSWSEEMMESSRAAEEHLYAIRFELEDELNRLVSPPRDLAEYSASPSKKISTKATTASSSGLQSSKQGWLMMRGLTGKPARYIWHRRWCYVKDGIFGWLSNNPKTGAVEESDKIGVLLCNVKIPIVEERRFTFEVLTKDSTILLQAESDADVAEWLSVFDLVKKAVLASKSSNEHAFSVTKPQQEFAAAPQVLESGHGEVADVSANFPSKKSNNAQDTNAHSLSALVSATGLASNLANPRISTLFGKLEDQKFFNPFEGSVESNDLSPSTFAPAPINTHLTRESLLDNSTSVVHGPSGTQANHWGSLNYGMLNVTNKDSFEGHGASKLLTRPEAAVDSVYRARDKELSDRGLLSAVKSYPPNWPNELRRQDAQFCSLFPHARNEHVLMVIRATRAIPHQKAMFSGRIYITLRGLYFYSQSSGVVLLQTCPFSEILSVKMTRKLNYDELSLEIHDVGESHSMLFLDDADLVKKRIELLLANHIADEPKGVTEMLSVLQTTLPDRTRVVPADGAKKRRGSAVSSDDEADPSRKDSKVDVVRLKLPAEPVLTEPDDQMLAKVYDAEYMLTAKGLFHLLFGNRSPVWLQCFNEFGVPNVQQGPWQTVEDGTLARAFRYTIILQDEQGTSAPTHHSDYQKISKREEHLDYTVTVYRRPWNLPNGMKYFMNVKINISFVSKTKSRLRMWLDIDWQGSNYLTRGVISKAMLDEFHQSTTNIIVHFIEREVLDRLGIQSRTSKAVRIYGRVGGHSEPMYLEPRSTNQIFTGRPPVSIWRLIRRYPTLFAFSLLTQLLSAIGYLLNMLRSFVTTNGLLLLLLGVSLLFNTWITGKSSMTYWNHKSAMRLVDNIGESPVGLMARGITLQQIEEVAFNQTYQINAAGPCFDTFKADANKTHNEGGRGYHASFRTSRESIARSRNDLLVAMRVLNGMETEIVKGEWRVFLDTEKRNCESLKALESTDGAVFSDALKSHCKSCLSL